MQNQTETEKFLAWYEAEKAKDLVDIKFFVTGAKDASQERFFSELNEAIRLRSQGGHRGPEGVF